MAGGGVENKLKMPSFYQRWQILLAVVMAANIARLIHFDAVHRKTCSWMSPGDSFKASESQTVQVTDKITNEMRTRIPTNSRERFLKESAEAFHEYLRTRQFQSNCKDAKVLTYERPLKDSVSLLSDIHNIAATMLVSLASKKDTVITLAKVDLPGPYANSKDCAHYSCLFLPLTQCTAFTKVTTVLLNVPKVLNTTSCGVSSTLQSMKEKIKLSNHELSDMLDWTFFLRETVRFIARPSNQLGEAISKLTRGPFASQKGWTPFMKYSSRVSIHMAGRYDGVLKDRFLKGLRVNAYSLAGDGLHQVLIRDDPVQLNFEHLVSAWRQPGTVSDRDLKRRFSEVQFSRVLAEEALTSPLTLLATAFIFAESDFFVGDFATNFSVFVSLLMQNLRFNPFPPTFDIRGDAFNELKFNSTAMD